jgi:DNA-binding NarL/FixJ family response regulator
MQIKNIFLIEDDSFFATTFRKKLEGVGNFKLHHFNNCEDAISQLQNLKPEVVFMDHVLRGTKGVDAIPDILTKEPETQVVVISNQNDINVVDRAFSLGAAKYFRKDILLLDYVEKFISELQTQGSYRPRSIAL